MSNDADEMKILLQNRRKKHEFFKRITGKARISLKNHKKKNKKLQILQCEFHCRISK